METSDIKSIISNIPLSKNLKLLIASFSFISTVFSNFISYTIKLYLLFYTKWWSITLLYLIAVWFFNKHIHEQLIKNIKHLRHFAWWKYVNDYFPVCLHKNPNVYFDPKRNYLFCPFPHGFSANGVISAFFLTATGYHELFPNHQPHVLTMQQKFNLPFLQDFLKAIGMRSVLEQSVKFKFDFSEGGNIAVVDIGDITKSSYTRPGQYCLVLKNQTDFVRLALRNGFALVPVFSFGETNLFYKTNKSQNPVSHYIKNKTKEMVGIFSVVPVARRFLQYLYGLIVGRKPINIVVGKPIDVEKLDNPKQKQINDLREKFLKQLTELFEEHKDKHGNYPIEASLVII